MVDISLNSYRNVAQLNPLATNPDGTLRSLLEQYGENQMRKAIDPNYRVNYPYVIAFDGAFTGVPQMAGKPIVISSGSLKHVLTKHGATVETLSVLGDELADRILAFEDAASPNKLTFILDARSSHDNDIIAVLRADLNMRHIDVSSIRSVHGKERDRLFQDMADSLDANREFYLTEKTGAWMEVQRSVAETAVTEKVIQRLSSKLYQDFKVPYKSGNAVSSTQKRSKGKLPGPDRAAKHATPAADAKAASASAKAQTTATRIPTPKVVK